VQRSPALRLGHAVCKSGVNCAAVPLVSCARGCCWETLLLSCSHLDRTLVDKGFGSHLDRTLVDKGFGLFLVLCSGAQRGGRHGCHPLRIPGDTQGMCARPARLHSIISCLPSPTLRFSAHIKPLENFKKEQGQDNRGGGKERNMDSASDISLRKHRVPLRAEHTLHQFAHPYRSNTLCCIDEKQTRPRVL